MVDEQQAVNHAGVEPSVTESPTVEPKTTPEPTGEVPEVAPKAPEQQEEGGQKSELKPVEKRIHKLVDERDRIKEERDSLAQQVEKLTSQFTGTPQAGTPYTPTIEPGAEVTQEQYKADVVRTAQSIAQLEVQKQRIVDNINKESNEAMKANPELDPTSEVFDKELSDVITESVKAQIQANPTASVKKLVEKLMKPYRRSVEKQVAETTETVAKQVSESAVRPNQVKVVEKPFKELTIEEMEAKLGSTY